MGFARRDTNPQSNPQPGHGGSRRYGGRGHGTTRALVGAGRYIGRHKSARRAANRAARHLIRQALR